jgi:hypothetical protein
MSKQFSGESTGGASGVPTRAVGHAALSAAEMEVLSWSRERRREEFQKVNPDVDKRELEDKLLFIDTMAVENGEILDALRTNPKAPWEIIRDIFTGGEVDGYTSTFHGLDDLNYPEHFWKAIIENEREQLIQGG